MENGKMENGFSVVDPLVEMGCRNGVARGVGILWPSFCLALGSIGSYDRRGYAEIVGTVGMFSRVLPLLYIYMVQSLKLLDNMS